MTDQEISIGGRQTHLMVDPWEVHLERGSGSVPWCIYIYICVYFGVNLSTCRRLNYRRSLCIHGILKSKLSAFLAGFPVIHLTPTSWNITRPRPPQPARPPNKMWLTQMRTIHIRPHQVSWVPRTMAEQWPCLAKRSFQSLGLLLFSWTTIRIAMSMLFPKDQPEKLPFATCAKKTTKSPLSSSSTYV